MRKLRRNSTRPVLPFRLLRPEPNEQPTVKYIDLGIDSLIGIFPTNGGHHSGAARLCLTVAARPISGPDTVIVIVG
ncbi:hypothetical protein J6590_023604 [Homalodisca vitripennis]|nr:hypothetical protein J6590_023604 [Homalodisca vitripennis]